MGRKTVSLLPKTEVILKTMGNNIRLARLRRDLSMSLVCKRANVSRATLWKVENGSPSVAIGVYASVLSALGGSDKELLNILNEDERGRAIQDLNIKVHRRGKL